MKGWLFAGVGGIALALLSTYNPFPPNPLDTVVYLAGLAGIVMFFVSAVAIIYEYLR